ncbi:MAG TPA: hypothetical protein VFA53_00120 [Xanthobacteraceae bacterium]|nr:hypothetical protein [Xanthobacteraceae bacterium]
MFSELRIGTGDDDFAEAERRIEDFPPIAQEIFEKLTTAGRKQMAERRARSELAEECREQRGDLLLNIRLAEDQRRTASVFSQADEKRLRNMKDKAEKLRVKAAELNRKNSETPERTEIEKEFGSQVQALNGGYDSFLHGIVAISPRRVILAKPATNPRDPKKIHTDIRALLTDFRDVRKLPPPKSEALEAVKQEIRRHGDMAKFNLSGITNSTFNHNTGKYQLGTVGFPERNRFSPDLSTSVCDQLGVSVLCRMFPNEMLALIESELDNQYKNITPGLPLAERAKREAQLRADWIELTRELVAAHIAADLPIPNVHPLAVLQVELGEMRPRPEAKQDWTWEGGNEALTAGTPTAEIPSLAEQGVSPKAGLRRTAPNIGEKK